MAEPADERNEAARPIEGSLELCLASTTERYIPNAQTVTIDGSHALQDSYAPSRSVSPATFRSTGVEGQSQSLHIRDLQNSETSAELEPFISPLENAELELEIAEDIPHFGKPLVASTGSLAAVRNGDLLPPPSRLGESVGAKNTSASRAVKPLWRIWALEIMCILLSFSTFTLIVVVLSYFDQKSLPDWPMSISLNSFLAFFATLAKAAFMLPVSIAISQAQWGWFLRERPLYDFHIFDQASRGTWGSLVLLWRIRCRHFVALGALLMICSTLTSPVTQLAIKYPMRDVAATGGASSWAVRTISSPRDQIETATRKAVSMATLADSTEFLEPISPLGAFCSTGNCTFDRFESLGVCMKMANISSLLRIEEFDDPTQFEEPLLGYSNSSSTVPGEKIWKASLPGGYELAHQSKFAVLTDMINGRQSLGFQKNASLLQTRIASFVLIYATPIIPNRTWTERQSEPIDVEKILASIHELQHEALEVLFHLCVQTYDTTVHIGVEKTRLASSLAKSVGQQPPLFLDVNCTPVLHDRPWVCQTNRSRWNDTIHLEGSDPIGGNLSLAGRGFSANYRSMELMATSMKEGLGGYASFQQYPQHFPNSNAGFGWAGAEFVGNTLFKDVLFQRENIMNRARRYTCLTNLYSNIATSLSSGMRVGQPQKYTRGAYNVTGQAWKNEPYVDIAWGWISFLAVELLLATAFLILTLISQSSIRDGRGSGSTGERYLTFRDIKDSSLATLVALSDECRIAAGDGLQSADELKRTARRLQVRLEGNAIVRLQVALEDSSPVVDSPPVGR